MHADLGDKLVTLVAGALFPYGNFGKLNGIHVNGLGRLPFNRSCGRVALLLKLVAGG